jgi:hypothetical protein
MMLRRFLLASLCLAGCYVPGGKSFYAGVGGGPAPKLTGEAAALVQSDDQTGSTLLVAGVETGAWGVELAARSSDYPNGAGDRVSMLALGLDLKYSVPLGRGFGVYIKGGLNHTDIADGSLAGRGADFGTGAQWIFYRGPRMRLGVGLDITKNVFRLRDAYRTSDGEATYVNVAFTIATGS